MALKDRPGRILFSACVLFLCVSFQTSGVLAQAPAQATQDKKPTPVAVVESVPLTVSGTVAIGGSPGVTVANDEASPVPVRDVDRASSEPFQSGTPPTFFQTDFASTNLVTVPEGKRLVIEYATAWVNTVSAGGVFAISLASGGRANDLTCHAQGENTLNHVFTCSTPMKHFVEAGQTLAFTLQTFSNTGGNYRVFVSGHYESVL